MTMDIESLERATLDAVTPQSVEELPDWLLPFDESTVGRAISAVPLLHTDRQSTDVTWISDRYAAHDLRAQFRVADVPGLAALHASLARNGYAPQQPTLTMVARAADLALNAATWKVECDTQPTKAWESVYLAADFDPVDGANRIKALRRGRHAVYAWIADDSGPIAAGVASFSRGWASFHGLRTLVRVRRKGLAQALIQAFVTQASNRGLENCFLQVEEANSGAVALYERIGFQTAWRYHYWRQT